MREAGKLLCYDYGLAGGVLSLSGLHYTRRSIQFQFSNVLLALSRPDIFRSKETVTRGEGGGARSARSASTSMQGKNAGKACYRVVWWLLQSKEVQGQTREILVYSCTTWALNHRRSTKGKEWHIDLPVFRHSVLPRLALAARRARLALAATACWELYRSGEGVSFVSASASLSIYSLLSEQANWQSHSSLAPLLSQTRRGSALHLHTTSVHLILLRHPFNCEY